MISLSPMLVLAAGCLPCGGPPAPATGWPGVAEVPAAPTEAPLPPLSKPSAAQPAILYYELVGALEQGRLRVAEQTLHPAAAVRLATATSAAGWQPCPVGEVCGFGEAPAGAPLELALWLAVLDRFQQAPAAPAGEVGRAGAGTLAQRVQGTGVLEASGEGKESRRGATREIVRFLVRPGVDCTALLRVFSVDESSPGNPAEDARARLVREGEMRSEWERRVELGLQVQGKGHLLMRHEGRHTPEGARYVLQLTVGEDVEPSGAGGRCASVTLRCDADRPLFGTALDGIVHEARLDGDRPVVQVRLEAPVR